MTRRSIRSYVIRKGRMTEGQRRALEDAWPTYGLEPGDGPIDPVAVFGRAAPLTLEIGFGMGDSLIEMAIAHPERDFIGIEVHPPGVGHLLIKAVEAELGNLRVFMADGVDVMREAIPRGCADRIQLFFPDPWHKKKHHKRRLLEPGFARLLADRLAPGGIMHIATDWTPYADAIRETMAALDDLEDSVPPARPLTKYEQRGVKLGHEVTDLAWRKR